MKYYIRYIMLCLVFGVVTTVAVAWCCAEFINFSPSDKVFDSCTISTTTSARYRGNVRSGKTFIMWYWVPTRPVNKSTGFKSDSQPTPFMFRNPQQSQGPVFRFTAAGWPFLALWSEVKGTDHEVIPTFSSDVYPLRPIWIGLFLDTLLYAFIYFLLSGGYVRFRRSTRRYRGYCPKCVYNLRADFNSGCPECGWNR